MEERIIKERIIKLSGSCTCPVPLSDEKRYFIAMEIGIENILYEPQHDSEKSYNEIYKVKPIGMAEISNPDGKKKIIKVRNSKSQNLRFNIQLQFEQKGLESKMDFEQYYNLVMDRISAQLEKFC